MSYPSRPVCGTIDPESHNTDEEITIKSMRCVEQMMADFLVQETASWKLLMNVRRWIQDRPQPLEWAYRLTAQLFHSLDPFFARMGHKRVARVILPLERVSKEMVLQSWMAAHPGLHSQRMSCPMTCPKLLRNGPCGGVRPGGYCEVYPERRCVWTDAYERSRKMPIYGEGILDVQPPVDWRLEGTSAWVNMLSETDQSG